MGQFVEQLAASGLMTAREIDAFRDALPPEKSPHDVQALARELILAGKLTKYQAQCVYQRKTKGLVLGEYVVLDKIGEGGMGQVLKARHRTMERIVALKILPPKSVDSPEGPLEGPVYLNQPGTSARLFGRAPRYVEKTKELFFAAPNPMADHSAWPTSNWDLWVIRGFDPAAAWQTGATSP